MKAKKKAKKAPAPASAKVIPFPRKTTVADEQAEVRRIASWVRALLEGAPDEAIIEWNPEFAEACPDFWPGDEGDDDKGSAVQ